MSEEPMSESRTRRAMPPVPPPARVAAAPGHRRTALASLAYVGAVAGAEVLTAVDPRLSTALHAVVLFALLRHGAGSALAGRRLYWALSLVPLVRILSASLPLGRFPATWSYAVVVLPLVLAVAVASRTMGYGPTDLGLRWRWRQVPLHLLVGLTGLPLGMVEYLILWPTPLAPRLTWSAVWLPSLILLVSTGFGEELLFRGLMQRAASAALGPWMGPLQVTLVSTVLHIGYRSWLDVAFVFLVGGLFALVADRSRSIWGVTLAHGMTNVSLLLIAPFIVEPSIL